MILLQTVPTIRTTETEVSKQNIYANQTYQHKICFNRDINANCANYQDNWNRSQ